MSTYYLVTFEGEGNSFSVDFGGNRPEVGEVFVHGCQNWQITDVYHKERRAWARKQTFLTGLHPIKPKQIVPIIYKRQTDANKTKDQT